MPTQEILDLDKNEEVLQEIRRHPLGAIGIYGAAGVSITLMLVLLYIAVSAEDVLLGLSDAGYGLLFGGLVAFIAFISWVAIHVYNTNELVVTNENIIQVLQYSLFSRQVSQLNLAKIQDVSVDQLGLLSTFFNFGTIEIETAGEAANFRFTYTPNPNRVAKLIIEAHEDYIRRRGNDQAVYDL